MFLIRDYIWVEISDIIINVFLLSEDFWEDGFSDLVLFINDIVEDYFLVCFFVFLVGNGLNFNFLCKFLKIIVFVGIIVVFIVICIVLFVLLLRYK